MAAGVSESRAVEAALSALLSSSSSGNALAREARALSRATDDLEVVAAETSDASTRHLLMEQVNGARSAAAQARVKARATALASKRSALLEELPRHTEARKEERGSAAALAKEINDSLRRATAVVTEEVDRSNAAGKVVEESSRRLRMTRDQHGRYGDSLASGSHTLGEIRRTERNANAVVVVSFFVFFVVAAYVARKRVVNSNVATFVVRPALRVVFAPARIATRAFRFAFSSPDRDMRMRKRHESASPSEQADASEKAREGREPDEMETTSDARTGGVDESMRADEGGTAEMRESELTGKINEARRVVEPQQTVEVQSDTVVTEEHGGADDDAAADVKDTPIDDLPVEDKPVHDMPIGDAVVEDEDKSVNDTTTDADEKADDDLLSRHKQVDIGAIKDETEHKPIDIEPGEDQAPVDDVVDNKIMKDTPADDGKGGTMSVDDELIRSTSVEDHSVDQGLVTSQLVQDESMEHKPVREKPTHDMPVEDRSVVVESIDDGPVKDELVKDETVNETRMEEKASYDKSLGDKVNSDGREQMSVEDKPAGDRAAEGELAGERRVDGNPWDDKLVTDELVHDKSADNDATGDKTSERRPVEKELVVVDGVENESVTSAPIRDEPVGQKPVVDHHIDDTSAKDEAINDDAFSDVTDETLGDVSDRSKPAQTNDPLVEEVPLVDTAGYRMKTVDEPLAKDDPRVTEADVKDKKESGSTVDQGNNVGGEVETAKEAEEQNAAKDKADGETQLETGSVEVMHEEL